MIWLLFAPIALLPRAEGHLAMSFPRPIPDSAVRDPLLASGSNFPCHGADLQASLSRTTMAAGEEQVLRFDLGGGASTAVHGGGSCQISTTYATDDAGVRDPANWKVLQSMIGGCPSDATGNLPLAVACDGNNAPDCVQSFPFRIPADIRAGDAILAWTWFNKIGAREMYMNCAAVTFVGGTGRMESLPSMFVANLADVNQCRTNEGFSVDFPHPGPNVHRSARSASAARAPLGSDCEARDHDRAGVFSTDSGMGVPFSTPADTLGCPRPT